MEGERLLTTAQAATILNIAPGTLVIWRCTRRVPGPRFIKIGRAVRYRYADLVAFIENHARGIEG